MHHTPIRLTFLALLVVLAVALASGGCGQVTGLSDDYQYDLVESGAATADGATDGATTDGPSSDGADGATGPDAANKCTSNLTARAAQRLNQYNGTELCKACLASSCCIDVDTCANNSDCDKVLSCKVDCTDKQLSERMQCFKSCTASGNTPALYTNGVGACATSACTKECGLQ